MQLDRPQRGAVGREAPAARGPAGHGSRRPGARGSALTLAQRWALPFLRAGRQTVVFGKSRVAVEIMLSNLRETLRADLGPRSRIRGYRGGYLPTERRSIERGLRDGEVLGVVSTNALELGRGHRAAGRRGARGLPGLDRRHVAADGPRRPAGRRERRDPRRLAGAGRPVRHPPPGVRARRPAGGGPASTRTTSTCCSPTSGARRSSCRSSPATWFGPGPADDLLAFLGEGGHGPPGGRRALVLELGELPGVGGVAPGGGARERRDHRHDAGPAAGPRRGRPVRRPGPRPPARDLHARVGAVPRGPARVGRAQGVRPPDRRGPLHVREPRRDPQAARRVRGGAGDRRPARPRRGDGRRASSRSTRSSSSSPTRTSAGARSTCRRSSSRRPPTG